MFSTSILDPVTLSVRQLKRILETRGVSYVGALEKQDLTTLVNTYGPVTQGDLVEASGEEESTAVGTDFLPTYFTCEKHFYEEVEDSKDSVWLIQVIPRRGSPLLDDYHWKHVIKKVRPFGVWTGVLNCELHPRLCEHKSWNKPLVILALPRGSRAKDTVMFRSITTTTKSDVILRWAKEQLASRLKVIRSDEELSRFRDSSTDSVVRVLLVADAAEPPLFYSALSVKFSGRITFAIANREGARNVSGGCDGTRASYQVITPEGLFHYGRFAGQNLNYRSMGLFLRTLQLEANDCFILSLIVVNYLVCFDFFVLDCKVWKHLMVCFWRVVKQNFVLLLAWLALSGLSRFAFAEVLAGLALRLVRTLALNEYASTLTNDLKCWHDCRSGLLTSVLAACLTYAWVKRKWFPNEMSAPNPPSENTYRRVVSYVMNWFFRPMATLTRPVAIDLDFAEEMELLIRHLTTPNIWLQPRVHSREYIDSLPLWRFRAEDFAGGSSVVDGRSPVDGTDTASDQEPIASDQEPTASGSDSSNEEETTGDSVRQMPDASQRPPDSRWQLGFGFCTSCVRAVRTGCATVAGKILRLIDRPLSPRLADGDAPRTYDRRPVDAIPTTDCAICLEQYRDGDVLCGLPCGHNYHQHCILSWLLRDKHHCPTCRWPSYKDRTRLSVAYQ